MRRKGKGGYVRIILGMMMGRAIARSRYANKIMSRSATAARLILMGRMIKRLRSSSNTQVIQVRTESAVVSVEPR